jgi:DNA-binding NarL/FixJ family response regulator
MEDIRILLVDDHQVVREELRSPSINIIMMTLYNEYLTQAIEAGAVGYLLKDIKREELIRAIRAAHEGRTPLNLP